MDFGKMNFETLEQFRAENTKKVMESMTYVACDAKAEMSDRLKAAKIVDGMSDSIIRAYVLTTTVDKADDASKRLGNQLKDLKDGM